MFFLEYYGPADLYRRVQASLKTELAAAFRSRATSVTVRRIVTEEEQPAVELWVELSSDEQLYRYGRQISQRLTEAVRREAEIDVWVMFKVVPLSNAFLNGEPRARGVASFE
jgi:hypothetical protein